MNFNELLKKIQSHLGECLDLAETFDHEDKTEEQMDILNAIYLDIIETFNYINQCLKEK